MLSFKPEIHYRLHKKSLNKTSDISHNYNKFSQSAPNNTAIVFFHRGYGKEYHLINWYTLFFYKQQVCKQLAFGWQIDKQLSGLSPLSLSNN